MRPLFAHWLGISCLLSAIVTLPAQSHAQAISTASRSLDIAAFGGYAGGKTDYGPQKGQGAGFGVDITKFFHLPVVPSLEGRVNVVDSTVINELSYMGGIRVEVPLKSRIHPYVAALAGLGTLHFKFAPSPGYTGDRGLVISYGGGVDFDLVRNISIKIDGQYQNWNLGPNGQKVPVTADFTLTPIVAIIGVEYHIPFRPHIRQRDFYH
jgi:opacity protein-like surface antigen